jgi:hypothetical protein
MIIPGRLIVQAWRATHWKKEDVSVPVLKFSKILGRARVDQVHGGAPTYDQQGMQNGWMNYCWKPWKKYLGREKQGQLSAARSFYPPPTNCTIS